MSIFTDKTKLEFKKGRQGLLVDLDTLFDTRLAVIEELSQEHALELIKKGWSERKTDELPFMSNVDFQKAFDLRDRHTLTLASRTLIDAPMKEWVFRAKDAMDVTPFPGFCEIFVNFWPYKFTRDEAKAFTEKFSEGFPPGTAFTPINFDPNQITLKDVRVFFSAIFMSNWDLWIEGKARNGELKETPLPHVTIFAPKIIRGHLDKQTLNAIGEVDLHKTIEFHLKELIGIQFLDIGFFSTIVDKDMAKNLEIKKPA